MLYPQINKSRSVISLNDLWKFRLLNDGKTFTPGELLTEDFEWLAVPASYNDQKEIPAYRRFAGLSVYQKEIVIPSVYMGQRLVLRFDAVANFATVYIGSREIMKHKGGYLPFEIDITEEVMPGTTVVVSVLVDNTINKSTLPVGNDKKGTAFFGSDNAGIPSVEAGKDYQKDINLPNFDFFNYAGLNRPVNIYTTPKSFIQDVTVVTDIAGDKTTGIVNLFFDLHNNVRDDLDNDRVTVQIRTRDRELVDEKTVVYEDTKGSGFRKSSYNICCSFEIEEANLWWPYPGDPYLYTACITYGDDYYELNFGIRTVKVEGLNFLINGEQFYFKGFGKHEDYSIHGRGMDLCVNVKDMGLIHWLNANSFRTSHYPNAEQIYDLCDREGIVIIDETPAVGIGAGGKNPYEYLDIKEYHKKVLCDMIARDKNHPCVVMWSLGNEPDTESHPQAAYDYWRPLYELAHELDMSGRPVTMVCCQNDYTKDIITRTMDVVCLNRYYGWYNLSGDLDAAAFALNMELDYWEKVGKPLMFTEYGADTVAGMHATVPEMFSEEYQAEFLLTYGEAFDARNFIVGEQLWNFADFGTIQGPMRADGNKKGLFTRERRPKLAAHVMRKRWAKIPNFGQKN